MTWKIINKAFGKKNKNNEHPEKIIIEEDDPLIIDDPKEIANVMNTHFTSVAEKLARELEKPKSKFNKFLGAENRSSIFLRNVDIDEVYEETTALDTKKAMGYDEIPPKIIKWAPHLFAPILQTLFNKCIESGHYPDGMKIAKVTPFLKKETKMT